MKAAHQMGMTFFADRQHFHRDLPLHVDMLGSKHHPHAAGSESIQNAVIAEDQAERRASQQPIELVMGDRAVLDQSAAEGLDVVEGAQAIEAAVKKSPCGRLVEDPLSQQILEEPTAPRRQQTREPFELRRCRDRIGVLADEWVRGLRSAFGFYMPQKISDDRISRPRAALLFESVSCSRMVAAVVGARRSDSLSLPAELRRRNCGSAFQGSSEKGRLS